jgi:uroporphyrinogen III methyltransferase/synthase
VVEKPLIGKRIVITRARKQAGVLAERIAALGGEGIELPTIEIEAPKCFDAFDAALARLESYDWLIFTSANSLDPFLARLNHVGKSVDALTHLKVAAVGERTATRLAATGISVDLVPVLYQAEGLLEALQAEGMSGTRVLIPQAAQARDVLPVTLRQWGAEVDVVQAYRTVAPSVDVAAARQRFQHGDVDLITFTSSSTVSNFVQLFAGGDLASIVGKAAIACIGPITAKSVEELGGRVAIMAREATIDGLVAAMVEYFGSQKRKFRAKAQRTQSSEN